MKIDPLLTSPTFINGLEPMGSPHSVAKGNGAVAVAEQLKTVAKGFESIFINQILKQMQETIKNSSFDPDDSSNEQVHSLYCTFLADSVSQNGGFGLWEKIYEQMADAAGLNSGQQTVTNQLDQKV
ncbi:MAG: rod-binding protein [Planctomycetes bacterium]|nr:rod-binding protein [Planctomycetota bacterium]